MLGDMILLATEMLVSLWGISLIFSLLAGFALVYRFWSPGAVFRLMVLGACGIFIAGTAGAGQFAWVASNMVFVPTIALAILVAATLALILGATGLIGRRG